MTAMKHIAAKILAKVKKLAIKTLKKIVAVPLYLLDIIGAVAINAAIMIPLVYLTEWYMSSMLGMNMIPPAIPENPLAGMDYPMIALSMFLVGLFEETYFRYLIMDCLFERWAELNKYFSTILASLAFGAAHLANLGFPYSMPQAVGAFGAGLWFAYIYRKKGLHFAILTHALYNTAVMIIPQLFS